MGVDGDEIDGGAPIVEVDANRRSDPRVDASFRVRYQSLDDLVVAYTNDISAGGLFVNTEEFLPVGSIVNLEIALPDDGPVLNSIVRVAHTSNEDGRRGMGMEFLDADSLDIARQLARYITVKLGETKTPAADPPSFVLVVDDDPTYRERVAMVMEKRGHRVEVAEDGLEALGVVLQDPPDLIIADVQMPTMDGWQLLRLLRARPSVAHIPVIFLTMLADEEERLKGYKLGVDDYIPKPFLFEELAARVSRVLARNRSGAARNALRGDLSQVSVASVLQFIELEKRTGLLLVVSGEEIATIHAREGQVVHVDFGRPCGELALDRLFRVLGWKQGRFELTDAEVGVEDTIGEPISWVLLEHARRRDEED